jgi:hypothetical protein
MHLKKPMYGLKLAYKWFFLKKSTWVKNIHGSWSIFFYTIKGKGLKWIFSHRMKSIKITNKEFHYRKVYACQHTLSPYILWWLCFCSLDFEN